MWTGSASPATCARSPPMAITLLQADRRGRGRHSGRRAVRLGSTRESTTQARKDRLFLKLDVLAEDRANGTLLTHNSTVWARLPATIRGSGLTIRSRCLAITRRQEYHASFSAVLGRPEHGTYHIFLQAFPPRRRAALACGGITRNRGTCLPERMRNAWRAPAPDTLDTDGPSGRRRVAVQHGTFAQFDAGTPSAKLFLGARHQFTGTDRQVLQPERGVYNWTADGPGPRIGVPGISGADVNELFATSAWAVRRRARCCSCFRRRCSGRVRRGRGGRESEVHGQPISQPIG